MSSKGDETPRATGGCLCGAVQFLKKTHQLYISLGWGVTPREVVDALSTSADGIMGEMPSGLPEPKAPNAAGQAWVNYFVSIDKHQVSAGA